MQKDEWLVILDWVIKDDLAEEVTFTVRLKDQKERAERTSGENV